MVNQSAASTSPTVNPLVQDLLTEGSGKVLMIGGFVGPMSDEHIRLYADLSLNKYIEIAKADVVRVIEVPENPEKPCIVFFKSMAELKYVQATSIKADEALALWLSRCPGCGVRNAPADAIARQTGGGPTVSVCEFACLERGLFCAGQAGDSKWRLFWCVVDYFVCRLGCDGPIIV